MKETVNIFGLSGGKDSTALTGWAIHESGYPRESLIFTFCDTGNEYDEVYEQIDALDKYIQSHGCKPVVKLRAEGDWVEKFAQYPLFLALSLWKGRFPSAKARFCTQFLKIKPTEKFVSTLVSQGFDVVSHSGVRGDESIERSVMEEWATDMFGCRTRRPLLKLTISDVWSMHKKYRLPINKLYLAGWKRVGCRLCIMSNKADVRRTVKKRPWVIQIYKQWEEIAGNHRKENGSAASYSSWFPRKSIPLHQRSKLVDTKKKGKMLVPTIEDVARWSLTMRGGKQNGFDFMHEEEDFNLDDAHAPCQAGYCE